MTDYTAAFLAQLADLQTRLTKQDATISMLKAEVDRLKENSKTGPVMRMSVPLNRHDARDNRQVRDVRDVRDVREKRVKPKAGYPTMSLSDVVQKDEVVTIRIKGGHDVVTSFDGTNLEVTECKNVPSLVGTKSSKPGEVLYKFMEELHKSGQIDRTFGVAPWKLCFVQRGSDEVSLEDLRASV
jgi:hypothetical protein